MSIRFKVMTCFLVLIAFFLGASVYAFRESRLIAELNHITDTSQDRIIAATAFRASIRNAILDTYDAIYVQNLKANSDPLKSSRLRVENTINKLKHQMDQGKHDTLIAADFDRVLATYPPVMDGLQLAINEARLGRVENTKRILMDVRDDRFKIQFIVVIGAMLDKVTVAADQASGKQYQSLNRLNQAVSISLVIGTLLSGLLFFIVFKSVGGRLSNLQAAAHEVASGNFSVRLSEEGRDEIAELSKAFNNMATSLKAAQDELASNQVLLLSTSKMSALGEMAGGVAHEINTPLAVIRLTAEQIRLSLERTPTNLEFSKQSTDAILQTVDRIAKIVRGLRTFSRDGRKDPFVLTTIQCIAHETMEFCLAKMKVAGVALELKLPPEAVNIECRSTEISQVFLNLISNSFDAVLGQTEKWIRVELIDTSDNVEIHFTDSGPGIPSPIREKVMQPFFTTKPVGKGTGLGLSVSRGIALSHHGSLKYDVDSDRTRFVLMLPKIQSTPNE